MDYMAVWYLITVVTLIFALFVNFVIGTNKDNEFYLGATFGMAIALGIVFVSGFILDVAIEPTKSAYRLGQINAICGKVEYERVYDKDSTIVWERITNNNNDDDEGN